MASGGLPEYLQNDPPPPYSLNPGIQQLTLDESIPQFQSQSTSLGQGKGKRRDDLIQSTFKLIATGDVNVYLPKSVVTFKDKAKQIQKVEIGERPPGCEEKVIMIVGATGSGKSTLINGMFNHILGIQWEDNYRLKLIQEQEGANQADSQTKWITSYTIHPRPEFAVHYSLTIIDTPGFGDTAGIQRDQEITDQIRACFTTPGPGGVDSLDAVGFVANSSQARLTAAQQYVFDSILALFGKDIADNLFMLLTFADGSKPPVLSGIKQADIPFKTSFNFNNSALYRSNKDNTGADESGDDNSFNELFWNMGSKSFKHFTTHLVRLQTKSLVLTKNVLEERRNLEFTVEGIQRDVKMGLNKLEQLKTEHQVLDQHQIDIDKNKEFKYIVNEEKVEIERIENGQYTTNCIKCNRTCHERCAYANDADKAKCIAMTHGYCSRCAQHCHWSDHRNQPYVYVIRRYPVTKTHEDLRKKYQRAKDKKATAVQMVKQCQQEFVKFQLQVLTLVEQARESIARLNEIALRPNPLSTVDYIEILIKSEKANYQPGWKERVEQLVSVKEKIEQTQAIAVQPGYDPLADLKEKYDNERKQRHEDRLQQLRQ